MFIKKVLLFCLSSAVFVGQSQEVIKVGVSADYKPVAFIQNNKIVGTDIDLVNRICEMQGLTCEIQNHAWDTLMTGLRFKKFNVIIGGITPTPARKKKINFSIPYGVSTSVVIVKNNGSIEKTCENCPKEVNLDDENDSAYKKVISEMRQKLQGLKSGSQTKSTYTTATMSLIPSTEHKEYADIKAVFNAFSDGELDFVLLTKDDATRFFEIDGHKTTHSALPVTFQGGNLSSGFAMGFYPGEDALKTQFNAALSKIIENGEYEKILKKWAVK